MIIYKYVVDPVPLPLYYVHQYINNYYFIPRFYTIESTCLHVHGVQKSVFVKSSFACMYILENNFRIWPKFTYRN